MIRKSQIPFTNCSPLAFKTCRENSTADLVFEESMM